MKPLCLIIGILFPIFVLEGSPQLRHVYLTWQHDPTQTITVNAQGIKTPSEMVLYYDTEPHFSKIGEYAHKVSAKGEALSFLPDGRMIYRIEVRGLKSGQLYYFALGDHLRAFGEEMRFRTIPENDETLVFVEGGDWENTESALELAKRAASFNPMAILLGGDYPSQVLGQRDYQKWDEWLDNYACAMKTQEGCLIPMMMAIGNHEVIGGFGQPKSQVPFFLHYFCQGETQKSYFSLPFGTRVHLYVLDSGHIEEHGGDQKKWLEEELKKTEKTPVKIALYHVPLFPSLRFVEKNRLYFCVYGMAKLLKDKATADKLYSREGALGRLHWLPLFDRYRMTVAFEHHDQTLKRTKLLCNGREDPNGTLYLGDGGWGPEVQYRPIQGYFHNYFATLLGRKHFFWVVRIDKEKISYEAVDSSGTTLDQFVQNIGPIKYAPDN